MYSTDPALDVGTYKIKITGSVPLDKMNPLFKNDLFINLSVSDGCATDTILNTATLPASNLYMIESAQIVLNPTWTQLDTLCPSMRDLQREVNSV